MIVAIVAMAVVVLVPVAVSVLFADDAVAVPAAIVVRRNEATGGGNQESGNHATLDQPIQFIHRMPRFCVSRQATPFGAPPGRGSV